MNSSDPISRKENLKCLIYQVNSIKVFLPPSSHKDNHNLDKEPAFLEKRFCTFADEGMYLMMYVVNR